MPGRDDDMNLALGRFLSESSDTENVMLSLFLYCNLEALDTSFDKFMNQTFGGKIALFKSATRRWNFSDEDRLRLQRIYDDLDALLPIRNFIVHGTTHQMGRSEAETQPYRMGRRKGDNAFMDRAVLANMQGEHVFTIAKVEEATKRFGVLTQAVSEFTVPLMFGMAGGKKV